MNDRQKLKQAWEDRSSQKKYFRWLMQYSKPYLWKIILLMAISISGTFVSIGMALMSKTVIDNATAGENFRMALIVYVVLMIFMQVADSVSTVLSTMLNEYYSFGIRKQVYDKILRSVWLDTQKYHSGDLMTRMTSDAGNIANGVINVIPNVIELLVELIAVFVTLFMYSKILAVFALLLAPMGGIVSVILGRRLKAIQIKVQESETNYRSFIQESLANLLIVKAFSNEDNFSEELVRLRQQRFNWVWKKNKLGAGSSAAISITFELGYIAAFTYGVLQISAKAITYGTMTVFLTLVNRIQSPVIQLAQQLPGMVSILASAGRIMDIQNIPLEEYNTAEAFDEPQKIGASVSDLSFGYNKDQILKGCSFEIKPGEFIALVGESGIGKTTLIRLMLSLLKSEDGEIFYIDSAGKKSTACADMRKLISYVPQGNTLFSGTLRNNIMMGKKDATEEELQQAIDMACCRDFINEMPDGIDTVIGEKGLGISEGQAQRIAIARAFIRKSPFLILDEATSALDEITEHKILEGLRKLTFSPTCLLITHRRSVLQYCDRELKIENNQIVEMKDIDIDKWKNQYVSKLSKWDMGGLWK